MDGRFSFPFSRPEVLQKWVISVRRVNFKPTKFSRLCSDHFTDDSYQLRPGSAIRRLKEDAVPTIFNYPSIMQQSVTKGRVLLPRIPVVDTIKVEQYSENEDSNEPYISTQNCETVYAIDVPKPNNQTEDSNKPSVSTRNCPTVHVIDVQKLNSLTEDSNEPSVSTHYGQTAHSIDVRKPNNETEDSNEPSVSIQNCPTVHAIDLQKLNSLTEDSNESSVSTQNCPTVHAIDVQKLNSLTEDSNESSVSTQNCPTVHAIDLQKLNSLTDDSNESSVFTQNFQTAHTIDVPKPNCSTKAMLRQKIKNLQGQLRRRNQKISSMKGLISDLKKKVYNSNNLYQVLETHFDGFPLEMVINQYKNDNKSKSRKCYTPAMKQFALTLYFYSPKAYSYVRSLLHLPHQSRIKNWISSAKGEPGFLPEVKKIDP